MNKVETKKFLTEWNELFGMGYSEAKLEKDSQLLSKMTPKETEENRSQQVKCHYASLIQHELQKLTEDQLFKVLVLVKNTTDEMTEPKPVRSPKPSRNRALFDPTIKTEEPYTKSESSVVLKKLLMEKNLNGGYGIISMFGKASDTKYFTVSEYICFCLLDKVDMMVEVATSYTSGQNIFILSVVAVGEQEGINMATFYNLDMLTEALNNIVKQYKK